MKHPAPVQALSTEQQILSHLDLVPRIATKLRRRYHLSVDLDEMISYGMMGLVEAAHRFDSSHGVRFSSFAYRRIYGAIIDGLGANGPLPRTRSRETQPRRGARYPERVPSRDEPAISTLLRAEDAAFLESAIASLPKRLRHLVRRRYWRDDTLVDIGREIGVSKSRASRLHASALEQLREHLEAS